MLCHSYVVGGVRFDVDPAYTLENAILLGEGSFGQVVKATLRATGQTFAVKKIKNVFDNLIDAKRTLRELRLLAQMNHENVISIRDIMPIEDLEQFVSLYLVTDLLDTDLHNICASSNVLTDDHCKYIIYQVLRGLKYVHSAGVIHRDLKPSNILINANSDCRICDFGLARVVDHDDDTAYYTSYVATRWYRAPEVILEKGCYSKAVDVWSVGCILAELLGRTPLFPGRDSVQQLSLITDVLGNFSAEQVRKTRNPKARAFMRAMPRKRGRSLYDMFPSANPQAVDLMQRMLHLDPDYRISVEEALAHPYLSQLHLPSDEPVAASTIDFNFEAAPLTEPMLRALIFNEMLRFHPELGQYIDNMSPTDVVEAPEITDMDLEVMREARMSAAILEAAESLGEADLAAVDAVVSDDEYLGEDSMSQGSE
ncbi:uncharacterized protein AMSG_12409 [Thecamonas trahens ATCC 50062]|uniref:Mitogen-activated protein kinase n=1 Tax=Thecamonas trahens ATCC 50062 TaxID=461836 RepID=A0A0L0DTH6_THETB|nr:hypothetical protein AMSG_12409 [Thecamonas trahens ATCC 50062]KNC55356.1 hypothetical protein AMSG_12409 [Thecamonas trahens ATCC 50062]|eukprot:XP_013753084.1 hypothetical protein AMSG_12409 [Thecamonas trahens ATCC 50062]